MSFSRHSEPKRTSMANGRNGRSLLSVITAPLVIRRRRSRGAGRARENLWPSRSASGLTRPVSTRACARSAMVGSSAGASEGIDDRANAQTNGQWRSFTELASNVLDPAERGKRAHGRHELDGGDREKDGPPKRGDISEVG